MSILAYAICFAAGIATNAIYTHIRRAGECKAYKNGYNTARREEEIRREAIASKRFQDYFYSTLYTANPSPRYIPQQAQCNTENRNKNILQVDESFMDDLHNNGRAAVVRIVK